MQITAETTSDRTLNAPSELLDADSRRLVLHDDARTSQLDHLFDDHFTPVRKPTFRVCINHWLKRGMDIAGSAIGLAIVWPVIALAALGTLLDTGRPIFYVQTRRIRFGRRARIYKMRTLIVGADKKLDALVSIKHDGKFLNIKKAAGSYTRIGRFLERLWIVELPQLWNVLKGEMSIVGNRPIPDYVVESLGTSHEVIERFAGPQGLTGYVQILGRDRVTDDERIALEYRYSRVFEEGDVFLEDLRIIFLTILSYLGLTRDKKASDFLATPRRGSFTRPVIRTEIDSQTKVAARSSDVEETGLACPTCLIVEDTCDESQCQHECAKSCEYDAIRFTAGRATINDACVSCSACIIACPVKAIDKAPLHRTNGHYTCNHCDRDYPVEDGVLNLLTQREDLEESPYFDFYDQEYTKDNPQVHVEDTDWKFGELMPLLQDQASNESLLDLGCGAGVLSERLASSTGIARRTASDWSSGILACAREHDPAGRYVRADAAYLPFRNGSFDLAMLIDVIEHQHQPDQVLRELQRVSKQLLMRTPLEECWYERQRRKRKDLFHESSGHVVHFDVASVRRRLADNGWSVKKQTVRHIDWSHWKRVLKGEFPLSAKLTAFARAMGRYVMPMAIYRKLFVTDYNALCESDFHASSRVVRATSAPQQGNQEGENSATSPSGPTPKEVIHRGS